MASSAAMSAGLRPLVAAKTGTNTGASARKVERCCGSKVPVVARRLWSAGAGTH